MIEPRHNDVLVLCWNRKTGKNAMTIDMQFIRFNENDWTFMACTNTSMKHKLSTEKQAKKQAQREISKRRKKSEEERVEKLFHRRKSLISLTNRPPHWLKWYLWQLWFGTSHEWIIFDTSQQKTTTRNIRWSNAQQKWKSSGKTTKNTLILILVWIFFFFSCLLL